MQEGENAYLKDPAVTKNRQKERKISKSNDKLHHPQPRPERHSTAPLVTALTSS